MKHDAKADGILDAKHNGNDDGAPGSKASPANGSGEKSDAISNGNPNDTSDASNNAKSNAKPERDCVLCGCCLELCPLFAATSREEFSPRAKALLSGPSKFSAATLDDKAVAKLAGLCLACGKCEALCPQGVSVPRLLARLRAEHPDFRQWLWRQWITRLQPHWALAARGAALVPDMLAPAGLGLALKGLRGLRPGNGLRAWLTITKFPVEAFRQQYGERPVALFDGCVGSGPRQAWADTARHLLRGLGANRVEAGFSCCGSTLGVAGLPQDQLRARRANVEAWRKADRPLLVTYCATCRKGLAEYVGAGIFADHEEEALWTASVAPLSGLLLDATARAGRGAPAAVGWHRPCHADAADADFLLLQSLLGARLRSPARANCCGFGGILQLGAPELSAQVGAACWGGLDAALGFSAVPEVVSGYVLSGCSGCVMQLGATAPAGARAGHWLEIIRQA
ncbi:MAG: (Fe-S)-binding protein [Proteobacteria bacterium]|nr:(Fe-S)-binding protein [Pseudomonadota bacterium]MBU1595940.1 (Fe-S)-binding protein [Pseudomonadota bacterium]